MMLCVPDALFADPRLAMLYDVIDDERSDLDADVAIATELGATSVLDVGCGTGTLASRLADNGLAVTGIDPAAASLAIAERKPGASAVTWIHGTASDAPALGVDVAVMTGNVAQVFSDDHDWHRTLAAAHRAVRPGGWRVFETRDPEKQAWRDWTKEATHRRLHTEHTGAFETWTELIAVEEPLVTFRHVFVFDRDNSTLSSTSTLRFRSLTEIAAGLDRAGFVTSEVRDAPERPGLEFVVLAHRPETP